ncbi:MAG: hypothetical protein J0L73_22255 [Verrucomicrobia bacterium]|nr:hypothetical protein [Verrucomicrobiota bacterium]
MKTNSSSLSSLSLVAAAGVVVGCCLMPGAASGQTPAGPFTPDARVVVPAPVVVPVAVPDVPVVAPAPVPGGVTVVAPAGSAAVTNTQIVSANGVVDVYEPGTRVVLREATGPVAYTYGPGVVYATPGGVVLTAEQVKTRMRAGLPIRVEYVNEGPVRVVRRVVIDER